MKNPRGLTHFMRNCSAGHNCGWNQGAGDIVSVNGINAISQYCRITADNIRINVSLYVNNNSRQTQNNDQRYRCIMNSITKECGNMIINRPFPTDMLQCFNPRVRIIAFTVVIVDSGATAIDVHNLSSFTVHSLIDSWKRTWGVYVGANFYLTPPGTQAFGE